MQGRDVVFAFSVSHKEGRAMLEVATIGGLIGLCRNAISGAGWLKEVYDSKSFSDCEKEILIAASGDGVIQVIPVESILHVYGGGRLFRDDTDAAIGALYFDAFRHLCERGLILSQDDGELFSLTGKGFEVGRRLAEEAGSAPASSLPYLTKQGKQLLWHADGTDGEFIVVEGLNDAHVLVGRDSHLGRTHAQVGELTEALGNLCNRELATQVSLKKYRLTESGFKLARRVKQEISAADL
jgi:hypothetical protein